MANTAVQTVAPDRVQSLSRNLALIVGATLLMDILGRFSLPLPFSPVPLTLANFGVLLIALTLGSRRAAAAMLLYLAEGAMGMPVFSPFGLGGVAQILGPTGGYLMSYPVAAFLAGWIAEHGARNIFRMTIAAFAGEVLLFLGGITWLMTLTHVPLVQAVNWGVYPFAFAEIIKIMSAVAGSVRLHRSSKIASLLGLACIGVSRGSRLTKYAYKQCFNARSKRSSVAHSPDSDDAFMFYGLATNKVRVPGLKFSHTLCDIETLNRKAMDGVYDVTAISFHAYPYIQDKYALDDLRRQRGRRLRPHDRLYARTLDRGDEAGEDCRPRDADHRVPRPEAVLARHRNRSGRLRPDHPADPRRQSTKPG